MNEKLQLIIGQRVMVTLFSPSGADITIFGEMKINDDGSKYFVHPDLAPVIIGFTAEQVSHIDVPLGKMIRVFLK